MDTRGLSAEEAAEVLIGMVGYYGDDIVHEAEHDACLLGAAALRQTKTWQPIATAPKRKTVLVAWADRPYWAPETLQQRVDGVWTDNDDGEYREPTHWMPFPAPPVAEGTEANA